MIAQLGMAGVIMLIGQVRSGKGLSAPAFFALGILMLVVSGVSDANKRAGELLGWIVVMAVAFDYGQEILTVITDITSGNFSFTPRSTAVTPGKQAYPNITPGYGNSKTKTPTVNPYIYGRIGPLKTVSNP